MRSDPSFLTIAALAEKELFAADNINASTRDVSDTTTAAASLTTAADFLLRWSPGSTRAAKMPAKAPPNIARKAIAQT